MLTDHRNTNEFLIRLGRILSLGPDEAVNERVTLVERGLDSLVAVEVQAWLVKKLDVDGPVLKEPRLEQAARRARPRRLLLLHRFPRRLLLLLLFLRSCQSVSPQKMPSDTSDDSTAALNYRTVRFCTEAATPLSTPANESLAASALFGSSSSSGDRELAEVADGDDDGPDVLASPVSFGRAGFWF
ncbi:hypothetical protein MAPG_10246 [Magnaporthiopsis poae ATCC 64411]|uniref:Uncharacterized protein n=1 Tax=Magnaporthiopsis poae (strain ATCC 64411 / 73-15) TaxID=644358 RepID=A0A0C4EC32_MAGP6|nr:hypothetical protein MAPG_10246 [Magnaporthiopsis poae ATCC 64411]